jgi:hypothetical protein
VHRETDGAITTESRFESIREAIKLEITCTHRARNSNVESTTIDLHTLHAEKDNTCGAKRLVFNQYLRKKVPIYAAGIER